ncbi:xanthosine operon transcriptional regulator [Salmonella enterica subsp. enterica]|uniref:Xanthosine operon transcriptional regulator n=1 Tax=Salmonella enterica I TaxID=59201 RepID=A0A447TYP3_SALET|nr:xanthosine operon transcriptional regulator [Salmonella enterica subsp. enterica]
MADGYAQMSWPGVVFRPLEERIPADLYIVYDQQQANASTGETGGGVDGIMSVPDGD